MSSVEKNISLDDGATSIQAAQRFVYSKQYVLVRVVQSLEAWLLDRVQRRVWPADQETLHNRRPDLVTPQLVVRAVSDAAEAASRKSVLIVMNWSRELNSWQDTFTCITPIQSQQISVAHCYSRGLSLGHSSLVARERGSSYTLADHLLHSYEGENFYPSSEEKSVRNSRAPTIDTSFHAPIDRSAFLSMQRHQFNCVVLLLLN